METKTWTTVDRSEWSGGPWDNEPDKTQWADATTGLPCIARRGGGGAWCGYVGVLEGHPWHGKDYCDIETAPDVHGGVTFTGPCHEEGDEATSICHVPEAGEPDNVWWLGFDCGHHNDLTPAYSSNLLRDLFDSREASGAVYRTLDYVKAECASLAQQAVAEQPAAEQATLDRAAVEALRGFLKACDELPDEAEALYAESEGRSRVADPRNPNLWLALPFSVLRAVLETADEGFGHAARQREAEHALMLLLLREENAEVEFTPAEMVRAPADGSFVSSHNVATGGERLAFVAAKGGAGRG